MEHDPNLDNLIIEVLMANEHPITQNSLCQKILKSELFDFSQSPLDEGDLSVYVWDYFDTVSSLHPDHLVRLSNNQYAYTPQQELLPSTAESIRSVRFQDLQLDGILNEIDDEDIDKIAFLWCMKIMMDEDKAKYLHVSDARVRYAVLFEMIDLEDDRDLKESLIEQGLNDPNIKINLAAIKYITSSSSEKILLSLCDLMEDEDIFRAAQLKSYEFKNEIIYNKYLELAKGEDFELSRLPADMLLGVGYAAAIPFQFKILENWDNYEENYKQLGFTQSNVEDQIISTAKMYQRLPRTVKNDLIKYCHSTDLNLQNKAMQCMEGKWAKSEFKLLESIVTTDNPISQKLQIHEMARLNAQKSLSAAVGLLQDPDKYVRNAAVEVVGDAGTKDELKILLNILKEETEENQHNFDTATLLDAIKKLQG